jgi:hypothetical protein
MTSLTFSVSVVRASLFLSADSKVAQSFSPKEKVLSFAFFPVWQ